MCNYTRSPEDEAFWRDYDQKMQEREADRWAKEEELRRQQAQAQEPTFDEFFGYKELLKKEPALAR